MLPSLKAVLRFLYCHLHQAFLMKFWWLLQLLYQHPFLPPDGFLNTNNSSCLGTNLSPFHEVVLRTAADAKLRESTIFCHSMKPAALKFLTVSPGKSLSSFSSLLPPTLKGQVTMHTKELGFITLKCAFAHCAIDISKL